MGSDRLAEEALLNLSRIQRETAELLAPGPRPVKSTELEHEFELDRDLLASMPKIKLKLAA